MNIGLGLLRSNFDKWYDIFQSIQHIILPVQTTKIWQAFTGVTVDSYFYGYSSITLAAV